jgi:hypothetical protein
MTTRLLIPPLSRLTTLISRRTQDCTAGLVTTGTPREASVQRSGHHRARQPSSPGRIQAAKAHPLRRVNGRPTPSSRS